MSKRKIFTKLHDAIPLPDLLEIQKESYQWFFKEGLKELFEEISPIRDWVGRDLELFFGDYYLDEPKFDERTAQEHNATYEASLRVKVKLVNKKTGKVDEREVYLGDFPLMTQGGSFIINGIERVIVSQLIRSPGVLFTSQETKDKKYYGAKIIPYRGAWLELETDQNKVIWVRIDRKRKTAVTSLLRAFGYDSDEEIKNLFKDQGKQAFEYIEASLKKDFSKNESEGLIEVYRKIRPGDLATIDNAKSLIYATFFNLNRYDFSRVGRHKLNQRFEFHPCYGGINQSRILRQKDLVAVITEIIRLNITQQEADDIDHLGNRRVRTVGELLQNRVRLGLTRMERIIKDRMSILDVKMATPIQLINSRPVTSIVKEFFMSNQLSQFMDQTNPLAELEHKRRLSVMGPGGLAKERAKLEVRDVHRTYYGRICPIATPEGPNVGLVGHLAVYARINEYGFLETPFRKVIREVKNKRDKTLGKIAGQDLIDPKTKKIIVKKEEKITSNQAKVLEKINLEEIPIKPLVTNKIIYLDAFNEERFITTAASTPIDAEGYFLEEKAEVRFLGKPVIEETKKIDFMDVSPKQIVSLNTALIPFLEHNDPIRALMGSNMQRQAVPCISPEAPIVATGVEEATARNSKHLTISQTDGKITYLDASKIEIEEKRGKIHIYPLAKFIRSNQSTCLNQKLLVEKGQKIKKGEILADGTACQGGEIALGQNLLVAFMSWEGGNFEDAILISDRLVREDLFSSIHIENYSVDVRDTKLGPEIVTKDIPNVSMERLKNLDEEGIVCLGAEVSSGDILVGKITPKGETELSAEEKLLRAIFGEKAKGIRDSSLRLEQGKHGKVVGIKVFSREKGDRLLPGIIKTIQISVANLRKIQVGDKMAGRHGNKGVVSRIIPQEDLPFLADGTPVDIILNPLGVVSRMNLGQIFETHLGLAAKTLGYRVITPVLDGIKEKTIKQELKKAGFPEDGKIQLYDGRTGEPFHQKTTVGYIYMMKLNHLVEDKVHQRSIGPYSLITQQPLGGKAQFGGQRFGEMEVWALEGYGAAYSLQEMLTIKSDDVPGRSKAYESIIKDESIGKINIPESFNVLVRELRGLGIDVELLKIKN
jgi:DNA-directed RNA polymerase subunit beta